MKTAPVSQLPKSTLPTTGKVRLFPPAALSLHVLPNGVRSVVEQTQGTDLVSVQVWVRAGSRYENESNNGVANLIETLALRGSKSYPRTGRSGGPEEAITALGGQVGALTARDSTFYSATSAAAFLPAVLRALSDATLRPNLTDAAVEDAKLDVGGEVLMRASDPVASANDLAYRVAFTKHPYRWPANGTPTSIAAITGGPVRLYHKKYYVGSNISVVIVGDVQPAAAHKLVAAFFSAASASPAPSTPIPTEPSSVTYRSMSRNGNTPLEAMSIAFRAPGISQPSDVVAMDVLLSYWKEGSQAALRRVLGAGKVQGRRTEGDNQNPDDESGSGGDNDNARGMTQPLAQAFDVDFLTQRDPGLLIVSLLQPRSRDEVVTAIMDEVKRVQKQGLTTDQIAQAKRVLAQQYIEQSETVSGQAGALGFYEMISSYEFGARYLDLVAKVTPQDIKRVANRYLSTTAYVRAIIEPAPRIRPRPQPDPDNGTLTAELPVPRVVALPSRNAFTNAG